jgi:hypothetical protein
LRGIDAVQKHRNEIDIPLSQISRKSVSGVHALIEKNIDFRDGNTYRQKY